MSVRYRLEQYYKIEEGVEELFPIAAGNPRIMVYLDTIKTLRERVIQIVEELEGADEEDT